MWTYCDITGENNTQNPSQNRFDSKTDPTIR